jgi:DNA-binding CsgD family transcriptional regulator
LGCVVDPPRRYESPVVAAIRRPAYVRGTLEGLRNADLRSAIAFVEDAWALAGDRPFSLETLAALAQLIPCDSIGYSELDRVRRREIEYVGPDDGGGGEPFWAIVDEHPLCRHQQAYSDFSATRRSDVISHRRLVTTRVYAEWFSPCEIEAELEAGIARSRARTRTFVFERTSGDFSVRDRAVLELVRPHLARIYETTQLRRAAGLTEVADLERLTTREAEVLELVACGLTNAAIADRLWIAAGTVKKHLDNIYAKLDVTNRTAAAARIGHKPGVS